MSGTGLREARAEDWEAVAALHAASWQHTYRGIMSDAFLDHDVVEDRRRYWREKLAAVGDRDLVLLAEGPEGLAGFIAVWPDPEGRFDAYVDNLHVDGGRQGQGIGRRLLAEAARRLVEADRRRVYLWVFDANAAAVRFYLSVGGSVAEHGFDRIEGRSVPHTRIAWTDAAELRAACRA